VPPRRQAYAPLRQAYAPLRQAYAPLHQRTRPSANVCAPPTGVYVPPPAVCAPQPAVWARSNPDHPTGQQCGSHHRQSKSKFTLSKFNKTLTLIGRDGRMDGRDETDGRTDAQTTLLQKSFVHTLYNHHYPASTFLIQYPFAPRPTHVRIKGGLQGAPRRSLPARGW
jgi:hypothetical protein